MTRTTKGFLLAGIVVALLLAGVVSRFASSSPDGLEKVAADKGINANEKDHALGDSPFADYGTKGLGDGFASGAVAGVAGVRPEDAGAASGVVNVAHQMGGTLGLAFLVLVFASASPAGLLPAEMFVQRIDVALLAASGLLAAGFVLAVCLIMPSRRDVAQSGASWLPVAEIMPDATQPRTRFDPEMMARLVEIGETSLGETAENQINLPKSPPPGAEFQFFTAVVHGPR